MSTVSIESDTRLQIIRRKVCLTGLTDLMFDRYPGDNQTKLDWFQKVYLTPGTSVISLPATNIVSFLSSHNTNSAPKRLRDKRKYKDIANACLSFCIITNEDGGNYIPIIRNDKPIELGNVPANQEVEQQSGIYLHRSVARLDKGIPNPKERPVLPMPWQIKFSLQILPNKEIKEQEIKNLFSDGGLAVGLGTYRGVFGKFIVTEWE